MKFIFFIYTISLVFANRLIAQEIDNSSLFSSHPWKVDQIYIDSIRVADSQVDTMIFQCSASGAFDVWKKPRQIDSKITWIYDNNTKRFKVYFINYNVTYNYDVLVIEPDVLVMLQDTKDADNIVHKIEYRFIPYIEN